MDTYKSIFSENNIERSKKWINLKSCVQIEISFRFLQ